MAPAQDAQLKSHYDQLLSGVQKDLESQKELLTRTQQELVAQKEQVTANLFLLDQFYSTSKGFCFCVIPIGFHGDIK